MAYQQQQTLVCSAKAEVRQNQPSHSVVDTAAPSVRANCLGNQNNSSLKVSTMSNFNLSASFVSAFLSVNEIVSTAGVGFGSTKSVKKVAPSSRMKISKASREAQHRLAAIVRRARQSKSGWLRSPAYQALCRQADHASRVSQTTPPAGGTKAGASSKTVIKYSRLSDGEGVYGVTPAVRVHRTFVAPVTRRERHLAAREQLKAAGLLPNQAPALGKALKEQRKAKAKAKSLAASPVARPRDINRAAEQLEKAAARAARLSEAVKAASSKKKEQRVDNSVQEVVIQDDFLTQLEFLRTQLDANLAPTVPQDFTAAAAEIVAERKIQAEATGTDDMVMLMSLSTVKDAGGSEVNVLTFGKDWSTKEIDRELKSATKNVMVNLVGRSKPEIAQFTKRGFVLVTGEWYCLPLDQNKQLTKETPVRAPIVSRAVLNPPKLVVRERADGSEYLHLFSNVATPKNIKELLLAKPQKLEVLVNISPEQLAVADRDKFVEFLRANGFESYSTHENWLVLPAGRLFAEPKVAAPSVVARLNPWSFDTYAGQEEGLQLSITIDSQEIEAVLTITDDEADSYAQAEKLGVLDSLKTEVLRSLEGAVKDVHYLYDTRTSPVLHDLLNNLGFVNYSDTSDGWLVKRAAKLPEVIKPITEEVKSMYITVHSKSKTKATEAVGSFTVGGTTIPVEVDQAATEPANRLLCVKQAVAFAVEAGAKSVSIEVSHANYDLNKLAAWKAAGFKGKSNVGLLKDIESLTQYISVNWIKPKNKGVEEVVNTVAVETVAQAPVREVQTPVTTVNQASHQVIGGETYVEDGILYYPKVFSTKTRKLVDDALETIINSGAAEITSFGPYSYTCLGNYYWTWEKKKGEYSSTQPNGSPIVAVPELLKGIVESWLNGELKVWDGQYVVESCLVNFYEGKQKLNCHQDKSEEIDAPIVSISLGAAGRFLIREGGRTGRVSHEFTLSDSDLLVMYGKHRYCWHEYAGNIQEGQRVNLTFRMVKKPAVVKQEVRTVQDRTATTPVVENKAVEQKPAATIQDRVRVNPNFEAKPRITDSPFDLKALLELLPQSEIGKLGATPGGISPVFTFKQEERTGLSEVIIAAFSMMLDPATGDFVVCNINTPSQGYSAKFLHYGTEDVLEARKASMNVMSGAAPTSDGLPYSSTPFVCNVSKHCVDGARGTYIAAAHSSVSRGEQQANVQIILGQPGGESALTKENSVPGVETEARRELRAAVLAGDSKTIYSTLYKDDKDEVGTETSVTVDFAGVGLETILADGRRHTFVIVAWFDKEKHNYFTKGGKQFRVYPHTASVFHVDDLASVFGGNSIFKFDVRALLDLAAAPVVEAEFDREVKEIAARTPIKPVKSEVAEVQNSIDKANLALELAELHKHTRLRGQPLLKGLTLEEVKRLRKNIGPDGLVAHRTLSYIKSRTDGKPVQLFDWTKADVLKVAEMFFGLMPNDKATADQQVFCYRNTEEGLLLSFDAGTIQFLIGNDGRAYNAQDGRAFEQGMELIGQNVLDMSWWDSPEYAKAKVVLIAAGKKEPKKDVSSFHLINGEVETKEVYKPVIEDVCFSSSIGKFMQAFCAYLLMFAQSKNNTRKGLGDNFKILLSGIDSVVSMTEGDILGQNGGFLYSVQNSPKLYVHKEQCDIRNLPDDKVAELAGSVATVVRGYAVKPSKEMLSTSSTDTQSLAMKVAFEKYPALGFHFAKGTFINGLTHLRLATLQKYAPTLFNKTLQLTGLNVKDAVDSVISLTLKASKGAKRATLALARAVEVLGEVKAGWAFYGQEKVLTGWLVQECMAPTFVMAPGMSFFLGDENEKPVALVRKTQTERFNKFLASNLEGAVSMTGITKLLRCLPEHTPIQTYDEASATYRITFDKEVKLLKGIEIAFVRKEAGQGADARITFNENEVAFLNDITWTVNKDLEGKQVLVVSYSYTLHHRNPKLRGVIKTMMASCDKELLYNWFNNQKLIALGLNDIKLVAPQDTIKSDMLYSWLMVIGNTIRHNDPTNPHIAELIRLRNQLNQEMMDGADYDQNTIVINPAAVVAGLYSELISYFSQHFGHSLWMHVQLPGDQGEIMNRLYVDRVAQNAGWVDVPETAWGQDEKDWAANRREDGYTVKLYAESADYINNDKQNALLFTLDADGVVVEYLHRSFCFVGAEGAPVYGVELFESSTVAEAISDSRHMPPSVRSLSRMEGVAFDDAWALLNAGKEKMFMSLVIAGMSSNDNFNCSKTVTILERGDKKDKNLVLSAEDKDYLNSILTENNINLDYYEDEQFKSVAHAFRDIVFVAKGKSYWLPALFAINKLKSESSTNNLAQQFFREILVECLAGRSVAAIEGSRAAGILDSLCDSASTKKLVTAAANVTGKRIALPHIPAGEIHILKSTHPASEYQNLLRNGFKLKEVEAGKSTIFTHNSRAPLTDGSLLKLVIVTEEQNNKNFWKLDSDSFALGSMGNGMDFGDFDGDGHYFVQLVGTDYKVSTFESVADFISDAVGYDIFYTYANPTNTKGEPNEAYLADHYNIKKWSKVDETLCNLAVKKATKPSATYLMYNQNAREMQAKATGIAYSVYMWSEHLVDILLAYKKLGGVLPLGFDAADGSLVAPISQVYEVILGGFSDPAWKVYTKYFLKMKEGDRTVFDHNLAEFNRDLMAMGITGQKQAGFSALMFASYHLFFLEKWGAFNDYEDDAVTKNPLPLELKGMLACALVSFELMRGKFQGFAGALAVEKGGKVTGHKTAMNFARTFLSANPGMVNESLVCKQLAQTIEVCDHLLAGKALPKRSLGATPGVIQERTVAVPTSNLSDEALQHFLTKVGAEPNTPSSGDGGAAVEAIDYDAYLATEEIVEVSVEPTVEQPVYAGFKVVEEYYSESELEDIAEQEEEEFAVSNIKLAEFEVLAEQVEQPVQSEVIENGTKEKMATLMQVVEQLPESALDKLLAEGEKLLAELTKAKKPVREVKAVEPLKEAEPVTTLDNKTLVQSLVSVVNITHASDSPEEVRVAGDRESLLGNPFKHDYRNEALRAISVAAYGDYYNQVVYQGLEPIEAAQTVLRGLDGNFYIARVWKKPTRPNFLSAIVQLWNKIEEHGFVEAKCWCSPKQCHLDVVKADIEKAGSRAVWLAGVYQVKEVEVVTESVVDEAPSIDRPAGGTKRQSIVLTDRSKKAAEPKVTNSSSKEILPVAVVEEVKAEVVKAHPLDGLAPLSLSTVKPMIKDIAMAAVATQFIGTSAVSKSSTELYRQAWADWKGGCANTGVYTAEDVVMVSGNGSYRATEAQIAQTFTKSYVPYLALVVSAKATVVVGDCSGMDCLVRDYLVEAGYQKTWVAAEVRGYNKLTPPSKPKREVLSKESIKQPVKTTVVQPEGDWIEALVSKLESWTGNQIKKALATLSSEQLEAARIIIQHAQSNTTAKVAELDPKDVVGGHILTGKAGTGKSYTADVIIQVLDLLGYRVVACGTTGLASQNLKNSSGTINRVLGLGTGFEERKDAKGNLLPRTEADISRIINKMVKDGKVAKRLSEQSDNKNYIGVVLLVDEAFMLGGDLGVAAAEGLKTIIEVEAQKGKVRQRPVQLLMVGDPKQLEPVKDRMIFEEGEFLEYPDSTEIQKYHTFTDRLNLKVIKLEKNERQSGDSAFGLELDLLGEGKAKADLSNCPVLLSRFKASLSEQPVDALHIIFNNDEVAKFNKSKLDELVSKGALRRKFEASMDYSRCGKGELLGYVTPTPETLELVVGAPVRVTQNIPKNDGTDTLLVANGERGVVTHMAKDKVTVKFKDGRFEELEAIESRKIPLDENGAPIGSFKQLPLCLCWATTFHGSQGQTYPKGEPVIVHMYSRKGGKHNGDLQRVWSNNAFYVACSRVTRAEDLFFYTGLGVDEKEEGVTDEEFTKQRMNTYFNHFKASYRFNKKAIAWLDKQSC